MKILKFDLLAVGPFTNQSLDLSAGHHGLHVILGPNEAGKSSALRALRSLLYGFSAQTPDNFVHENSRLRVGATLRHSDGSELRVIRRKGNRDTLLRADGSPIAEAALGRMLGAVDASQFATFFGIGHEDLRQGGAQMMKGGGKVGESLFAAGPGGLRLRKLLDAIEASADELYKSSGRRQKIPEAINAFRDALKIVDDHCLSVGVWSAHDAALSTAKAQVLEIQNQIDRKSAERNRLERLGRAIPLLTQRRSMLEAIAAMGNVPVLADDFAETRRNAARALADAEEAATILTRQIADFDAEIARLLIPAELLLKADAVEELHGQLGSYRDALQQLPTLRARQDQAGQDAERILRDLRPDLAITGAEVLRLNTARREQLQSLSRESEGLKQSLRLSRGELSELEDERRQATADLAALPESRDSSLLQATLTAVQQHGNLEKLLADGSSELSRLSRRAEGNLKKLGLWSGTLAQVETLAVPSLESIEHARSRQEKIESDREKAGEEVRKLEKQLTDADHRLALLRAAGEILTQADLQAARAHRQAGWSLVRQVWLNGSAPVNELARFTAGGPLAETYERSVTRADELADVLRAESDRVAQQATLVLQRKLTEDNLLRERQQVAEANAQAARAAADWKDLWASIGVEPLSPREMSAWATRLHDLAKDVALMREQGERLSGLQQQIACHRQTLVEALGRLNNEPAPDASLQTLLARGQDVIEQIRLEASERSKLHASIKKLDGKIEKSRKGLLTAEQDLAEWRKRWELAVKNLGVPDGAEMAAALAIFSRIEELFVKIDLARSTLGEIAMRQKQVEAFEQRARVLIGELASELDAMPINHSIVALYRRLKQARDDATRRDELTRQQKQSAENLGLNASRAQKARETQARLVRSAGCQQLDQLPAVEEEHRRSKHFALGLSQTERELVLLSNGESIEELAGQAHAVNADELPSQLTDLMHQVQLLTDRRTELDRRIGSEEEQLRRMDGNDRAGEAADQAQELLASLRDSVGSYARLKLAATILRRGIERYRKRKQGPLLELASQLFADLTLGSFVGLQTDYDANDQPVLVGLRPGGGLLGVGAMSDGARDQLYLSLRLATLEEYVARNEPIPFVVDDILVNFDDSRAKATLKALTELATMTQVILFTHHAHIAALARECGNDVHQSTLSSTTDKSTLALMHSA